MPQPKKFATDDPRLQRHVHDTFAAQRPLTLDGISAALSTARSKPTHAVRSLVERLRAEGRLVTEGSDHTSRGIALAEWHPAQDAVAPSLADVLEEYVVRGGASTAQLRQLRAVLRAIAPNGSEPTVWLARMTWRDVPALHRQVISLRGDLSKQTRRSYRARWRAWLRWIARSQLVPLAFPRRTRHDTWALWIEDHFGRQAGGAKVALLSLGSRWEQLGPKVGRRPDTLDEVSVEVANAAVEAYEQVMGPASYYPGFLRTALVSLGMAGHGPYAALRQKCSLRLCGQKYVPAWYLASHGTGWEGVLASLVAADVPAEPWQDFLEWYHSYSTLPTGHPYKLRFGKLRREEKRVLSHAVLEKRLSSVRQLVGLAIHTRVLAASEITPEALFVQAGAQLLDASEQVQHERLAEQKELLASGLPVPSGAVGNSPHKKCIIAIGLLAEAFASYAAWKQALGHISTDAAAEHRRAAMAVYKLAKEEAKKVKADATDPQRRRRTKNTQGILRGLSGLALVDASNRAAIDAVRRKAQSPETARQVQSAILGALVSSGQVRIGELSGLTYDALTDTRDQTTGQRVRYLTILAANRKVHLDQFVAIPEELVPWALWTYHREVGRRLLAADADGLANIIFVGSRTGKPNKGRAGSLALAGYFERWRRAGLRERNIAPDLTRGGDAPHAERNRALHVLESVGRGHYGYSLLGHKPSSGTIAMYGAGTAEKNNESVRTMLRRAPWRAAAAVVDTGPQSIRGTKAALHAELDRAKHDAERWRKVLPLLVAFRNMETTAKDLHAQLMRILPTEGEDEMPASSVAA